MEDLLCMSAFRNLENIDLKLRKSTCDRTFLETCLDNNITPKFLNFKLYREDIRSSSQYKKFQEQLLEEELINKTARLGNLKNELESASHELRNST